MKSSTNQKFRPLFFFVNNKKVTSFLSMLLVFSFLNLIISCSYYNVRDVTTTPENVAQKVQDFNMTQKYAIVHSGADIWHLSNLIINEDNKTISGEVQSLNEFHVLSNRDKE